jgi:hypothetical protein
MRLTIVLARLSLALLLSSCSVSGVIKGEAVFASPSITPVLMPSTVSPTRIPNLASSTPAHYSDKSTQEPTQSATSLEPKPSATPWPFRLCSPLATLPFELISKAISDPYHPPPEGGDARHHGIDLVYSRLLNQKETILGNTSFTASTKPDPTDWHP